MRYSNEIDKISPALVTALSELENIQRDKQGQVGRQTFMYATLGSMLDVVKPVLAKSDICVIQFLGDNDRSARVETIFLHKSGQWICGHTGALVPSSNDPKEYGVNITSVRRFALSAACGFAQADETSEGASSYRKPVETRTTPPATPTVSNAPEGTLLYPFGKDKGTPITECSSDTLKWFLENRVPQQGDNYYEKNMVLYKAIENVIVEREGDPALALAGAFDATQIPAGTSNDDDFPF